MVDPRDDLDIRAAIKAGAYNNDGYRRIFGTAGNSRVKLTPSKQRYVTWVKAKMAAEKEE